MLDSQFAGICAATYDANTAWDVLWTKDNVLVGLKDNVVAFRGSVTPLDWFRDFMADLYIHPVLGGVERGFSEGADDVFTEIVPYLNQDTVVCGHSLGAARAIIFAGLMAAKGIKPAAVVVFGSPRPGLAQLSEILAHTVIRSYKNRTDPVTDVPLPFLGSWYVHPCDAIHVNCADPTDFGLLADHHIGLYEKGVQALECKSPS